jgi:hypothetical protein
MKPVPALLLTGLVATACGGRPPASSVPLSQNPAAAVEAFLAAVNANDLASMGQRWGTDRGPAANWMDREVLHQRLTVIQSLLVHERFAIEPGNAPAAPNKPVLHVRLFRHGCQPVVPFTMVQHRGGWLVENVALEAAGNPARSCQ